MPTDLEIVSLLDATLTRLAARPRPESTYRLQFHKGFTFRDAAAIVAYLHDLGITHVYASPYLKAAAGSTHGYDVIDHNMLNPELGTQADYDALLQALEAHGMSHILDTVPNHAGVATNENAWWNDVLLHGPASAYGAYFDIAWRGSPRAELHDKLLLPLLGAAYSQVLEKGEFKVTFEKHGAFLLHYYERHFPVNPSTIPLILPLGTVEDSVDEIEYYSILTAAANLPAHADRHPAHRERRRVETLSIHHRLALLADASPRISQRIGEALASLQGKPGVPESFDRLDQILQNQAYRLTFWRNASDEINYRRFFDINDLAALSMEHEQVFLATHELLLTLLAEEKIAGLRIDHPDGLYDPAEYFQRLQLHHLLRCAKKLMSSDARFRALNWAEVEAPLSAAIRHRLASVRGPAAQPLYVSIEKILAVHEALPDAWPINGTSGYDFLINLNGLFVDPAGKAPLTEIYHDFIGNTLPFEEHVYEDKRLILENALASELQMLAHDADRLAQRNRQWRDFTLRAIRNALREVIACFPVYRSYITGTANGVSSLDADYLRTAMDKASKRNPKTDPAIFEFLSALILQQSPASFTDEDRAHQQRFAGKFQQLTAPVTAKGIEDTAFYRYHRLISLNEVGGDPDTFGTTPEDLHRYLATRQAKWPYALSPLSTHDTKRSEDVRARIHALSELPDEWRRRVTAWKDLNKPVRPPALTANDEYLLYETLLGAWPLEGSVGETFTPRIQAYMMKALREAKVSTAWTDPNAAYEDDVKAFVAAVITNEAFLADFLPFAKRIAHAGLMTSLSQTLLRLTAPGVPDTYQGTELWDFSLVDPDNRRPVDYAARRNALESVGDIGGEKAPGAWLGKLLTEKNDGRIKLFVTRCCLQARRKHPGLFSRGDYTPLVANGPVAKHVFAFLRRYEQSTVLVIAPRLLATLTPDDVRQPLGSLWNETSLQLPKEIDTASLKNVFTRAPMALAPGGTLSLADAFRELPFALYVTDAT